jgi:type IV pilus assembly protein PilW
MHHLPTSQRGFTLIELMVSVTIGLLLLAGLSALFVGNNQAQAEVEKANRQVENGRYAMQLLGSDLRNAGFYGEFDPTPLADPAAVPDTCATSMTAIKAALPLPVQGYDNVNPLGCLADVRDATDIIVVRHTATCALGEAGCDVAAAGGPFLQASLCNNQSELGSGNTDNYYAVGTDSGVLHLHKRDCTAVAGSGTLAVVRRLETHIYFIANNNIGNDGIPTLKRAEVVSSGAAMGVNIVPLVEGIENLQIEYGIDIDNDGVADQFTTVPATVANWRNVMAVKVNLLARTQLPSAGYTDKKSYILGEDSAGQPYVVNAANDHFKRHVFSALVGLPNQAGRKS